MFPKWNSSWLVSDQVHPSIDRSYIIPHRRVQKAGSIRMELRRSHAFVFVIYIYIIVDIKAFFYGIKITTWVDEDIC